MNWHKLRGIIISKAFISVVNDLTIDLILAKYDLATKFALAIQTLKVDVKGTGLAIKDLTYLTIASKIR